MHELLAVIHPLWLYHILDWPFNTQGGYNFDSGIGVGWIACGGMWWRHNNCHHKRCLKRGHKHPDHGWPSCKVHWEETPDHIQR